MDEKTLEKNLCGKLEAGKSDSIILMNLKLRNRNGTKSAETLGQLISSAAYEVFEDTSSWSQGASLSTDLFGGTTPDIVIRSASGGENRIIIEVKYRSPSTYKEKETSQIVRYFLHLRVPLKIRLKCSKI